MGTETFMFCIFFSFLAFLLMLICIAAGYFITLYKGEVPTVKHKGKAKISNTGIDMESEISVSEAKSDD